MEREIRQEMEMKELKKGMVVRKSGGEIVRVQGVSEDIKNGRPGFWGIQLDESMNEVPSFFEKGKGLELWGYMYDIVSIIE